MASLLHVLKALKSFNHTTCNDTITFTTPCGLTTFLSKIEAPMPTFSFVSFQEIEIKKLTKFSRLENRKEYEIDKRGLDYEQKSVLERKTIEPDDIKLTLEFEKTIEIKTNDYVMKFDSLDIIMSTFAHNSKYVDGEGAHFGFIFSFVLYLNIGIFGTEFETEYHWMASESLTDSVEFGLLYDRNSTIDFEVTNLSEFFELVGHRSDLCKKITDRTEKASMISVVEFYYSLNEDKLEIQKMRFKSKEHEIKINNLKLKLLEGSIEEGGKTTFTFSIKGVLNSKINFKEDQNGIKFKDSFIEFSHLNSKEFYFFKQDDFRLIPKIYHKKPATIYFNSILDEDFNVIDSTITALSFTPSRNFQIEIKFDEVKKFVIVKIDRFLKSKFRLSAGEFINIDFGYKHVNLKPNIFYPQLDRFITNNLINISQLYQLIYLKKLDSCSLEMKVTSQNLDLEKGKIEFHGTCDNGENSCSLRLDLMTIEEPEFFRIIFAKRIEFA
eukprot:gene2156-2021_t